MAGGNGCGYRIRGPRLAPLLRKSFRQEEETLTRLVNLSAADVPLRLGTSFSRLL